MAKIAPFRGYRFNPSAVGDLNKVVTQPYDKIDDTLRDEYFARSEYNIARITKDRPKPLDTPNDNVYTRAAATWQQWIEDRIFIREAGPAIYPYYQEFTVDGKSYVRKGLVPLVCLDDDKSKVRAHEQTLSGPKADRLKLMRAVEGNDDFIFMLYDDPEMKINGWIDEEVGFSQPVMQVKDDYGVIHKLYRITRPSLITDINEYLDRKELFIADGHHRYETAVNYMNECKARNWKPVGIETFNYRMMTLYNMRDPGLVVLPTHRIVHSLTGFSPAEFVKRAAVDFDIVEFAEPQRLYDGLDAAASAGKSSFGFHAEGLYGYHLLTLKDTTLMDRLVPDRSPAWRRLDVTILHIAILDKMLGIDAAKLAAETNVHYVRGRGEALDLVGSQALNVHTGAPFQCQAAFLVNPTRVDQVREVASAGERMPQKSTDFFPKLLTGMVLMKMTIDKSMGLAVWEAEK
ncbi:MAG: DUF1015 domain-containing protein [Calditrichaeota bacterium]|nr:DUF1015 domain-containing protein [Calditrichota bacterium]